MSFAAIAACQIVKQGSGQFWGKQGLGSLRSKIFLPELNWLTTTILNGLVVLLFAVYVGQLTAQYFLVPSLRVSRYWKMFTSYLELWFVTQSN